MSEPYWVIKFEQRYLRRQYGFLSNQASATRFDTRKDALLVTDGTVFRVVKVIPVNAKAVSPLDGAALLIALPILIALADLYWCKLPSTEREVLARLRVRLDEDVPGFRGTQ